MGIFFTYLFCALVISYICSTLESVMMTSTLSFLTMKERQGSKAATIMKKFKEHSERPLAAILSLNTIANTVGAAGVGQQATILFGSQWFGVVSALMTLFILLFAEILPKTIGTTYWRQLMPVCAYTIHILIYLLYPIVLLIEWVSRILPHSEELAVSREEVVAMANVGEEEGVIEEDENKIIRNVMRLDDFKASDIMTPRVVAATAPEYMTLKQYYDCDDYDHFSRIPVYSDSPEYITGYILRDDALENLTEDKFELTLGDIKRSVPQFSETQSIGDIFDQMLRQKSQIGIVIDEYGCFQGILTLEDIIETIFGLELVDERDTVTDMQVYARERWQQRQKRFKPIKKDN